MVNRTAPSWGSRLRYALLACAMIVTLIELVPVSPAQGLSGDTGPAIVPGTDTSALQNTDGQWDTKNQHRVWYNTSRNEWDAIVPVAAGTACDATIAVQSAWCIVQEAIPSTPGSAPTYDDYVSNDPEDRPDVFWDQAANTLYVLMSGNDTRFYRFTYAGGTYTLANGPVALSGMNVSESRAAIYKGPVNGDLWASLMHEGGLLVARSTDNGDSWSSPISLITPIASGQTQITSFTDTNNYLAVAAAEDGDGNNIEGRYSKYIFYKLDLANVANWNAIVRSTATVTIAAQPTAGDTVTIDSKTYTFQTAPITDVDGNVAIGASLAATQSNLVNAVNGTGTPGTTTYAASTLPNGYASMSGFAGNSSTVTADASGAEGNLVAIGAVFTNGANLVVTTNPGFLDGGQTSAWTSEAINVAQTSADGSVVHSDDEISVLTYNNLVYIATETQRSGGDSQNAWQDPQVILFQRGAGASWTQSNVKMDQTSSDFDIKRPVVSIIDSTIYIIGVNNPRTESVYFTHTIAGIPSLGTGWGSSTPLFKSDFQYYRNNIVPRDRVTSAQRLPVLIDAAWVAAGNDVEIWQTSLPSPNNNQAPGVNAGADKTVAASPATSLGATVTDDRTGSTTLNWTWTVLSGPAGPGAGVIFSPAASGNCASTSCQLPTTAAFSGGIGDYVLKLTATESGTNPLSNSDEVTIHVTNLVNTAPVLTVTNPKNGNSYAQAAGVTFQASAIDNEAGDISTDIVWTSSKDGIIGFGGFFVKTDLSIGTHNIVATVTDGQNSVSSTPRTITVTSGGGGGGGGVNFKDIAGNTFEQDIIWLAEQGITKGCNPPTNNRYCPGDYVTRGQMAAFLTRAFGYANEGTGNYFSDTAGNTFEHDINKLRVAGVTKGCNPPANTLYCPGDFVTRGQMAAFLHRGFGG